VSGSTRTVVAVWFTIRPPTGTSTASPENVKLPGAGALPADAHAERVSATAAATSLAMSHPGLESTTL
jgi:hypothetical protein